MMSVVLAVARYPPLAELLGPPRAAVRLSLVTVSMIGVVVKVIPLKIIVTVGPKVPAENSPSLFVKQYCSTVETVEPVINVATEEARAHPRMAEPAKRARNFAIAELRDQPMN
jgi:hypothetical protein